MVSHRSKQQAGSQPLLVNLVNHDMATLDPLGPGWLVHPGGPELMARWMLPDEGHVKHKGCSWGQNCRPFTPRP